MLLFLVSLTLISVIQSNDPFFPAFLKSNNNLSVTVCHSEQRRMNDLRWIIFFVISAMHLLCQEYRMIQHPLNQIMIAAWRYEKELDKRINVIVRGSIHEGKIRVLLNVKKKRSATLSNNSEVNRIARKPFVRRFLAFTKHGNLLPFFVFYYFLFVFILFYWKSFLIEVCRRWCK